MSPPAPHTSARDNMAACLIRIIATLLWHTFIDATYHHLSMPTRIPNSHWTHKQCYVNTATVLSLVLMYFLEICVFGWFRRDGLRLVWYSSEAVIYSLSLDFARRVVMIYSRCRLWHTVEYLYRTTTALFSASRTPGHERARELRCHSPYFPGRFTFQ